MKKNLFLFIALIAFSFTAMAQVEIKPAFGLNFANLKDDSGYGIKGTTGYQLGGTVAFGEKFYVEPGFFWQRDNYDVNDPGDLGDDIKKGGYSTIWIPLNVGYSLLGSEETTFGLRVFGGPSVKFVTSVVEEGGITKDDFNNLLWGVNAGVGLDVWILFADLGYEWGLNEVIKSVDNSTNHHFWINFGVRIRLGGK